MEKESFISILVGANIAGNINFQVVREDNAKKQDIYKLEVYIQQEFFSITLSPQQAQWLCHFAPEAIKLIQQNDWSSLTVSYLERNKTWDSLGLFSKFSSRPALPNPVDYEELKCLATTSTKLRAGADSTLKCNFFNIQ